MWSWIQERRAEQALRHGEAYREAGRHREARTQYERALRRSGDRGGPVACEVALRARIGLGRLELQAGSPRRAAASLDQACSLAPHAWEPVYWRACALAHAGDLPEAERAFSAALERAPGESRIRVQRAFARVRQGRMREAREDLEAATAGAAHDAAASGGALLVLAALLLDAGEWEAAETVLRRIPTGAPAATDLLLGRALAGQQRWGPAAAAWERAARSPALAPRAWTCLATLAARRGDDEQALDRLGRVAALDRPPDAALFHHGWLCLRRGLLQGTLSSWSELARRHPEQARLGLALARVHHVLGWERVRAGDLAAAIPHWEVWCRDRPLDHQARAALAQLHLRVAIARVRSSGGANGGARENLERGLILAPEDPCLPLARAVLAALEDEPEEAASRLEAVEPETLGAGGSYLFALVVARAGGIEAVRKQRVRWLGDHEDPAIRARFDRLLAALHVASAEWSRAADVLAGARRTGGEPAALEAACLFRAGRLAELAELASTSPEVRFWQAGGLLARGLTAAATEALDELCREYPEHEGTHRARGRLHLRRALAAAAEGDWQGAGEAVATGREAAGRAMGAPHLDALLLLLADRREQALSLLAADRSAAPGDGRLAHLLAVASFHGARAATPGETGAASQRAWERALGAWVALVHHDRFWSAWHDSLEGRYGLDGNLPSPASVRREVTERFRALLDASFDVVPTVPRLDWLLVREEKAAAALAEAGGLPAASGDPEERWIVGPLALRNLGGCRSFARFVSELPVARPPSPVEALAGILAADKDEKDGREPPGLRGVPSALKLRLKRYFSDLGAAQALLELDRPQEALAALAEIGCRHCDAGRGHRRPPGAAGLPPTCRGDCPKLVLRNPGYAGDPDPGRALAEDARELAVALHLGVAQGALASKEVDLPLAQERWHQALELAGTETRREEVEGSIVSVVLGRVEGLCRSERLDAAVALIEAAIAVCHSGSDARLTGRLGEVLTDRGVAAGNARRWEPAAVDLRRAVELNPHAHRPLYNLALALRGWAQASHRERPDTAIQRLEEAADRLTAGTRRFPGRKDLGEAHAGVCSDLQALVNSRAVELAQSERFEEALALLDRGLRRFPEHSLLWLNRQGIERGYAFHLLGAGRFEEALARIAPDDPKRRR